MFQKKSKQKVKQYGEKNPIEALKEEFASIGDGVKSDLGGAAMHDFWNQLLQTEKKAQSLEGDLHEGEELDLSAMKKSEQTKHADVAPGIEYSRDILHHSERSMAHENQELEARVNEIVNELKRLISTSAELEAQFMQLSVEEAHGEVGEYHLNFFTWMLQVLRSARIKIEDSGSWMAALSGKKGKKNYWSMFKKHGTTFGLSNERTVATQTG